MTADQFWEQAPELVAAYRMANQLSAQRKSEEMWLQGLYICNAVGVVVGNVLRKKGAKALNYLEEPIRLIPLTEEEKTIKAEEERKKTIAFFNRLAKNSEP